MAVTDTIHADSEKRMQKVIDNLKKEFLRIRTGRATPALLEGVVVDYYGTPTPVSQVGTISIPDPRTVVIQPWEKSMIAPIEKAVLAANLGLNPKSDGNLIRLPIPTLSEERRRDLTKQCRKISEDNKVAVRNVRRDANEALKKALKDKLITEDEEKKGLDEMQKLTDRFSKLVDGQLALKEKELMEI